MFDKNISKYLRTSGDIVLLSQSEEVEAVKVFLKGIKAKRNETRKVLETNPKHSPEELEEDLVFLLGMIKGLNWALRLPMRSREFIGNLK